jgi:PAS domain S-box-containing protein
MVAFSEHGESAFVTLSAGRKRCVRDDLPITSLRCDAGRMSRSIDWTEDRSIERSQLPDSDDDHSVLEALVKDEELNRHVLDAVPGGVVVVARDGAILRANVTAASILGLRFDEVTSRYVSDFDAETIWEDGSPCKPEDYPVSKALVTGEAQPPVTIGIRRRDGSIAWTIFRAVPVRSPATGRVTAAVATFLEITERKLE